MEQHPSPPYMIEKMTAETYDAANKVRQDSWLDTYTNESLGITREWIESLLSVGSDPQQYNDRKARVLDNTNGNQAAYVARDAKGTVIGEASPYRDEEGVQHVGSLYVEKGWRGKGVGSALMRQIMAWADVNQPIVLEVASYNENAIAFYHKWGFVEVEGSERLHHGKIPVVKMVREGEQI